MSSDSESSVVSSAAGKRRRRETDLTEVPEDDGEENVVNTSRSKGVVTASLVIRSKLVTVPLGLEVWILDTVSLLDDLVALYRSS
jgi:hypothetical protein